MAGHEKLSPSAEAGDAGPFFPACRELQLRGNASRGWEAVAQTPSPLQPNCGVEPSEMSVIPQPRLSVQIYPSLHCFHQTLPHLVNPFPGMDLLFLYSRPEVTQPDRNHMIVKKK